MDYEKKYKEVQKWIESIYSELSHEQQMEAEEFFHELKESEDERIRKELIEHIKANCETGFVLFQKFSPDDVIAWLEKQGKVDMASYEVAENEKREFVGDGFIQCHAHFQDFKEGKTYWLEYVGNDNYNVRSDNLLGKTYHITPCQLYTIFKKMTWLEKQGESIDVDSILNKVGVKCAYKDGNAWCILYGDNIQDGVCGFGYTKEEALIEFLKDLLEKQGEKNPTDEEMKTILRTEYEKGRADVLRCIDPDVMVADFCSQPLSKTRSLASIYRQGIIDIVKRIDNNEKTSITSTHSIDDGGVHRA